MLYGLISVRLHGWLDDLITIAYFLAAWLLGFSELPLTILVGAGAVHFFNTRFTNYPQGQFKLYSLKLHGVIELLEGAAVLGAAFLFTSSLNADQLGLMYFMGGLQIFLALFAKTRIQWTF